MGKLSIRHCSGLLMPMAFFAFNLTSAWSHSARVVFGGHKLFSCHADRIYKLRTVTASGSDESATATSSKNIDEEVALILDAKSRQVSLIIQVEGGAARTYLLRDVEQGSSPGSGAGGKADTTIRGRSDPDVFTLFASYDSNGFDHDAALQVSGRSNNLLSCDSDMYVAPVVKGVGRVGSTNIYALAADGVAVEMSDLPAEPEIQNRP